MTAPPEHGYVQRSLETALRRAAREFPVVLVTGPRQSGKTTLLRRLYETRFRYVSLDPPDLRAAVAADPRSFLDRFRPPVIVDEVQHAPENSLLHQGARRRAASRPGPVPADGVAEPTADATGGGNPGGPRGGATPSAAHPPRNRRAPLGASALGAPTRPNRQPAPSGVLGVDPPGWIPGDRAESCTRRRALASQLRADLPRAGRAHATSNRRPDAIPELAANACRAERTTPEPQRHVGRPRDRGQHREGVAVGAGSELSGGAGSPLVREHRQAPRQDTQDLLHRHRHALLPDRLAGSAPRGGRASRRARCSRLPFWRRSAGPRGTEARSRGSTSGAPRPVQRSTSSSRMGRT